MDRDLIAELERRILQGRARGGELASEVAGALRDLILEGRLAEGTKLANEINVSRRLAISRPTWREAVRILTSQSLLESRRGIGTFVSARRRSPIRSGLDRIISLTDMVHSAGGTIESREMNISRIVPDAEIASMLDLKDGMEVVLLIERTRCMDGRPLSRASEFIVARNEREAEIVETFDGSSLFAFIANRLRRRIAESRALLAALPAVGDVRQHLRVKEGEPLLRLIETFSDRDGVPVLHAINHLNTEVVEFSLHRAGLE